MAVSKKELEALQGMWDKAKPQSDCNLPDAMYEFLIVAAEFRVSKTGTPQVVTKLKVVGGNESFIGETLGQYDNLGSPENMGWFKKKLARLGITIPENVEDLAERIPGEMKGKKFSGQLKTKDEFVNVYVNKLLESDCAVDGDKEEGTEEETTEEPTIQVGSQVMFTSVKGGDIEGEVIEMCAGNKVRVKTAEGKVFKVDLSKLSIVSTVIEEATEEETPAEEESEEEAPEAETTEAATEEGGFPTPEEIKAMKLPELKTAIKEYFDLDMSTIKNPRIFMTGASGFIYNEAKYVPDMPTLVTLRDGLALKVVKNEKPGDMKKRIQAELHKRLEF